MTIISDIAYRQRLWKTLHHAHYEVTLMNTPKQTSQRWVLYEFEVWYQWLSARLQYLHCLCTGETAADPPLPEIQQFWYISLKIQGQGHGCGQSWKSQHGSNILSTHIPLVPCQSAISFLRYHFFKIWPWKSKAKVMGEVNIESHNMGPTFYRLTSLSFHVRRPFHSWDTKFSKFYLGNPRWSWNDNDIAQLQV